jgi:hypothetical protein
MPTLQPSTVSAIFTADWHLSCRPPIARAAEKDWLAAQYRVIQQLGLLKSKYNAPIFVAGDLFARHDQPVWFVNWLMPKLRVLELHCIAGQHDIPNHLYSRLNRSAYWSLVEGGIINDLTPNMTHDVGNLLVTPFPWNFKIGPPHKTLSMMPNIALIHSYIWTDKTGYPGADLSKKAGKYLPLLKPYDIAAFGDAHIPWSWAPKTRGCTIVNCGCLIQRSIAEKKLRPRATLLMTNGSVQAHYLDTSKDLWSETAAEVGKISDALRLDLAGFVDDLARLREVGYDWPTVAKRKMQESGLKPEVQAIILKAVEEVRLQP